MQQLVAGRFGIPEAVLQLCGMDRPAPPAGQVVVRMLASAINPSDRLTIGGAYPHRTPLPFVPGYEGVGCVEMVGREVANLRVGQRVLPLGSAGGWQTYRTLPAEWCVSVPDSLSDDDAALSYVNPLTALLMIERLGLSPGQRVGINAAASTIGRMLIRFVHARGACPIAIVRSQRSAAALDGEPILTIVVGGQVIPPVDHGLDAVGGDEGARLAAVVRSGGVFVYYGLLSGRALPPELARNSVAIVEPFWLRNWVHQAPKSRLHRRMQDAFASMQSGLARATKVTRFCLRDFRKALAFDAAEGRQGKVLLMP